METGNPGAGRDFSCTGIYFYEFIKIGNGVLLYMELVFYIKFLTK